jgi:hypothetical protein
MKPSDAVFERAVPHEAGHVLVAYSFCVSVQQIAYRIDPESNGRIISLIAAPSFALREPTEEERKTHCTIAAAGMAGEVVVTGGYDPANLNASSPDKKMVSLLSRSSIRDFIPAAQEIIAGNRKAFDRLCSAIRDRYPEIKERIISSAQPGTYALLVKEDLDTILAETTPLDKVKAAGTRSGSKVNLA